LLTEASFGFALLLLCRHCNNKWQRRAHLAPSGSYTLQAKNESVAHAWLFSIVRTALGHFRVPRNLQEPPARRGGTDSLESYSGSSASARRCPPHQRARSTPPAAPAAPPPRPAATHRLRSLHPVAVAPFCAPPGTSPTPAASRTCTLLSAVFLSDVHPLAHSQALLCTVWHASNLLLLCAAGWTGWRWA
jgi:hypothetical protein